MYSKIAYEFSKTRTRPWRCVETFLASHPPSTLLDAGCGNGRNLAAADVAGFEAEGFDVCPEFVNICRARKLNAFVGDIEASTNPITKTYDYVICIAMLHHLRSAESRNVAMQRLFDALNPGGTLLFTVWSFESEGARFPKQFTIGDNIVPWKSLQGGESKADRYYYIYDRRHLDQFIDTFHSHNPDATIRISWEEQNWNVEIKKNK
jgi:tRNA (uracil-5-)-methyltransferase TRM9